MATKDICTVDQLDNSTDLIGGEIKLKQLNIL